MSRRLIILGGNTPRELALVGTLIVGRDPMCDVSEPDPLLSRRHAEFVSGAKDVTVRDLGSLNGILVNGVKRPQAVLHGGDVVQVGHLQVTFVDEGPALEWPAEDLDETNVLPVPAPPPQHVMARGANTLMLAESPIDGTMPTMHLPRSGDPDCTAQTVKRFTAPASPEPFGPGQAAPLNVQTFVAPDARIRFDMPKFEWRVISGGAAAIVSLAHNSGQASMVVERTTADATFGAADLTDRFAEREADMVRAYQPQAGDLDASLVALGTRRVVVVTYSRKGVAGPERVRQYSIPAGTELYRLTCSAALPQFECFESAFALVAATFATGTTS